MTDSDCLSKQTPNEDTVTLEEIIPAALGIYMKIEIKKEGEKKFAEGQITKIADNIIRIGKENYSPDTPVLGIIMMGNEKKKTSLCEVCCIGYCGNTPSEQCQAMIRSIMCRKAK